MKGASFLFSFLPWKKGGILSFRFHPHWSIPLWLRIVLCVEQKKDIHVLCKLAVNAQTPTCQNNWKNMYVKLNCLREFEFFSFHIYGVLLGEHNQPEYTQCKTLFPSVWMYVPHQIRKSLIANLVVRCNQWLNSIVVPQKWIFHIF
jgi:hypothetical protein